MELVSAVPDQLRGAVRRISLVEPHSRDPGLQDQLGAVGTRRTPAHNAFATGDFDVEHLRASNRLSPTVTVEDRGLLGMHRDPPARGTAGVRPVALPSGRGRIPTSRQDPGQG